MPKKLLAKDKKKDPVRLTPVQDRKLERVVRYFKDHRGTWTAFVTLERARRLKIDLNVTPSRQSLWIIALDMLLTNVRIFRNEDRSEDRSED